MKKLIILLTVVVLTASVLGCAATTGGSQAKVKCPACGYEFDAPIE